MSDNQMGEPVAWGNLANWCLDSDRVLITDKNAAEKYHRDIYDLTALYTTPQQRAWINLTDEELSTIEYEVYGRTLQKGKPMIVFIRQFAKVIESTLKAKNTNA